MVDKVRAFVKVNCEPSLTNKDPKACQPILRMIRGTKGVQQAYKTSNPDADFVAFLEAESVDKIYEIIEEIKGIGGVMTVAPEVEVPA